MDFSAIKPDLEKYVKSFAKAVAEEAKTRLTEYAKNVALEDFYSSYNPDYYSREYNIYNRTTHPYKKNNGNTYYGGVEVSSRSMAEYTAPHKWSNEQIFYSVMYWGFHGHEFSTPPYYLIVNYRDSILPELMDVGTKAAMAQSYSILNF